LTKKEVKNGGEENEGTLLSIQEFSRIREAESYKTLFVSSIERRSPACCAASTEII
jgi:hypothetical protein